MKRSIGILLCLVLLFGTLMPVYGAADTLSAAQTLEKIKKLPAGEEQMLWYAFLQGRLGSWDGAADYLSELNTYLKKNLPEDASEDMRRWQLAAMTAASLEADPTQMGPEKKPLDLMRLTTFGWEALPDAEPEVRAFALLLLDSGCYALPPDASASRLELVNGLLALQDGEGSFGSVSRTAWILTALCPYRNSSEVPVSQAIDRGLEYLSRKQNSLGQFADGQECAQVVAALCSLGVSPVTDERFAKRSGNALDGLNLFRMPDGTYTNSTEGAKGDFTTTVQAAMALASLERLEAGQRRLFDLRPEHEAAVQEQISVLNEALRQEIPCRALVHEFLQIPAAERSYVLGWDTGVVEEQPETAYEITPWREPAQEEARSFWWLIWIGLGAVVVLLVLKLGLPRRRR